MFKIKLTGALAIAAVLAVPAQAIPANSTVRALIEAGAPADVDGPGTSDSLPQRVDPNTPTSPYSGVVSINIRYPNAVNPLLTDSYICTGTLIDPTHVLSAGHCVDTTGNGNVIDVSQPFATSGRDVRVIFNAGPNPGDPGRDIITANNVVMHPDYAGFGNCPAGVDSFCVNDDLSIITLSTPAPAQAQIYAVSRDAQGEGTQFTMVGYGTKGNGWDGYTASPDFRVKLSGANIYDLTDADDEMNFAASSAHEVWYADFDGTDEQGNNVDSFCVNVGVCSAQLGNQVETNLGGGDSGGPSFVRDNNGRLYLVANNTFGGNFFEDDVEGAFGSYSGGILLYSYLNWIYANSDAENVPEPAMLGLFGLGAGAMLMSRRRKKIAA